MAATSPLQHSVHTRLRQHHLTRLMPTRPGGRMLEVGCGVGYLLIQLGQGWERFGIDREYNSLRMLHDQARVVLGNASSLPFPDRFFDLVLCSEVLEHLPEPEDQACLTEMTRVLKPGGRLLITVPSLEGLRARSPLRNLGHEQPGSGEYHYRIGYTWESLRSMIDSISDLRLVERCYSMFLFSELVMDLLKWIYFRKHTLKDQASLSAVRDSRIYQIYRKLFPLLHQLFLLEDRLLCPWLKGHIVILSLERQGTPPCKMFF
ncbi:MAG: methyltransferase domain-containing protein [Magnetococcales bacterium]|nr:methyltransferase domain-containing protein [Magnetococcales bacterium]